MKRIKFFVIAVLLFVSFCVSACGVEESITYSDTAEENAAEGNYDMENTLKLNIDGKKVAVSWEDNDSVSALKNLAKNGAITVNMSRYGGFEQVGSLGVNLKREDERITTSPGDIVLYSGNQIVIFYGSNKWAYTRLGKITDKTQAELSSLLGEKDVDIIITYGE